MMAGTISAEMPYTKKYAQISGRRMAYVEVGQGDPIVFLHGNPTSSYLWRNIIPYLEDQGRCIAPDLIGQGDSEKLPNTGSDSYTLVEHQEYVNALLEQLDVHENVTFVMHDWGSALGFHWTNTHRDAVRGLAYWEAFVQTFTWESFPDHYEEMFRRLRSPEGERMVLDDNFFVEVVMPHSIVRDLSDAEREEYARPWVEPGETRRPMLTWPRQIPIDGEPADVVEIVEAYLEWIPHAKIPKLLVYGDQEAGLITEKVVREQMNDWANQTVVKVTGIHYLTEDSPHEIGQALSEWYKAEVI